LGKALNAVDRPLHDRIEALHADANPVHAALLKGADHGVVEGARINLDGDFRLRPDIEGTSQQRDQTDKVGGTQNGWCAAAEMDVADRQSMTKLVGDQLNLAAHRRRVGFDDVILLRNGGMAAAVPAHPSAEGNMQVERRVRLVRNRRQPSGVSAGVN